MTKIKDFDIDKFMDEHRDLFESLANNIYCPKCRKIVPPPFYNLGEKYNSFEGCKQCYEELNGRVV